MLGLPSAAVPTRLHEEFGNAERVPRIRALCKDAVHYDIGLNIDAEEAGRLDISLDVIESISGGPELKSWQGFGMVVQAYQKRALSCWTGWRT